LLEADVVIADPPWPDTQWKTMRYTTPGDETPNMVFATAAPLLPRAASTGRVIVILGQESDPRILSHIPKDCGFLMCCWLRRCPPRYSGSRLVSADIAYVFGPGWIGVKGHSVLQGQNLTNEAKPRILGDPPLGVSKHRRLVNHPCPRYDVHMRWLVNEFAKPEHVILDPFAGSGTTGRACKDLGRKCIMVEIEEKYCRIAHERLRQEVLPLHD